MAILGFAVPASRWSPRGWQTREAINAIVFVRVRLSVPQAAGFSNVGGVMAGMVPAFTDGFAAAPRHALRWCMVDNVHRSVDTQHVESYIGHFVADQSALWSATIKIGILSPYRRPYGRLKLARSGRQWLAIAFCFALPQPRRRHSPATRSPHRRRLCGTNSPDFVAR